jgi:hypothetical protein
MMTIEDFGIQDRHCLEYIIKRAHEKVGDDWKKELGESLNW